MVLYFSLYNNYRTLESVSVLEDDLFGDTESKYYVNNECLEKDKL